MGVELLFLLLPVAAASGWWLGWRSGKQGSAYSGQARIPEAYFKGLNYLLREQPERASDVLMQVLDQDSESIEVHFTLANIFSRRGEVDRAIRIHQNLIARPTLSRAQKSKALYYLGKDYLRAGVLDRAEGIFLELQADPQCGRQALEALIILYQQQRDWQQAIVAAQALNRLESSDELKQRIAHFYCELAESHSAQGEYSASSKALKQALARHKSCGRAEILDGDNQFQLGKFNHALKHYQRVEKQDPSLMPDVSQKIAECYRRLGKSEQAIGYLTALQRRQPSLFLLLSLADLYAETNQKSESIALITQYLESSPSLIALTKLLEMGYFDDQHLADEKLKLLKQVLHQCASNKLNYHCRHCGFESKTLFWQCPSCLSWDTIRLRPMISALQTFTN